MIDEEDNRCASYYISVVCRSQLCDTGTMHAEMRQSCHVRMYESLSPSYCWTLRAADTTLGNLGNSRQEGLHGLHLVVAVVLVCGHIIVIIRQLV